jgi:polar amino acid transport system substrate-binding protein
MRTLLLAVLLWLSLAAPARSEPLQLVTYDYPPYMLGSGQPGNPGPVVLLVREALRRAAIPAEISFYPFQRARRLVEIGEAGGIFTLKVTPERERQFLFSREPLLQQEYVLYALADSPLVYSGDLGVLQQAVIGVVAAVSYGARFDAYSKTLTAEHKDYSTSHEANFRKLIGGRFPVLICSRQVGDAILQRLDATHKVKVIGPPVEIANSYLMFNPALVSPAQVVEFDNQLRAMRKDGSAQRIFDRHFYSMRKPF